MAKIRYIIMSVFACLFMTANAQTATQVLDKASAAFKSAGGAKIGFSVKSGSSSSTGTIKLKGQKFETIVDNNTHIWFNGKTMWTYVKRNEEVNVTTPSKAEAAKLNPYAFVMLYKNGYKAQFGTNTAKFYEVVLTGTGSTAYSKMVVRLAKSNYQPISIAMTSKQGTSTITVSSYATKQKYADNQFAFNKKNYPKAEVIDLR